MNILIAIGGKEYSKPTLDLGMKIANALEATTTIAYVGKKISQFSEKDVSVVHQNLDDRESVSYTHLTLPTILLV